MEAKNINALSFYKKLGLIEDRIRFSMNVWKKTWQFRNILR
jgi:hypothetical protein